MFNFQHFQGCAAITDVTCDGTLSGCMKQTKQRSMIWSMTPDN